MSLDADLLRWLNQGEAPEIRLLKFDAWARKQLSERLDWAWAGHLREKRIEQCRVYLERIVLDLWRRGWLLDGKRLASHIVKAIDSMATYQRSGQVREFWPYFRICVDRYVGANAEELRAEAMSAGSHVSQLLPALGVSRDTLPELMARRKEEISRAKEETLREKQARARRLQAASNSSAGQQQLF